MTRRDDILRWTAYGLALLLVMGAERLILNRIPVYGAIPVLLPLALVACAVLEGAKAGAAYGIAVGVLMTVGAGGGHWRVIVCSAAGLGAGLLARYVIRHDFVGHLLCCLAVLLLRLAWCVGVRLLDGAATAEVLLSVAIPELLWSMVLSVPVYFLYRFVCRRWGAQYFQ